MLDFEEKITALVHWETDGKATPEPSVDWLSG